MNCAEFIGIVKSGQPIILRRYSKEYIRLAENSLSVILADGTHLCLWLAANRKFKRILRRFGEDVRAEETTRFLHLWKEIGIARAWSITPNFPGFNEIAAFVYLTLIPEYWTIYLETDGKAEEALPLIEHEGLHSDTDGYDA